MEIFSSSLIETGIQIAIGLFFIFILLGFIVTQIATLIVNMLNIRQKQYKEALQTLITDKEIFAKLIAHPLIRLVDEQVAPDAKLRRQEAADIINMASNQVSYVPPSLFVDALLGILASDADSSIYLPLVDAVNSLPNDDIKVHLRDLLRRLRSYDDVDTNAFRDTIYQIPNETHKQILFYSLEEVENAMGRLGIVSGRLWPMLEGTRRIKEPAFKTAISTLLVSAQSLEEVHQKLIVWYNYHMDRISDTYRRKLQYITLAISLTLAIILNVDSLYLLSLFWKNPEVDQAIAANAESITQSNLTNSEGTNNPLSLTPEATLEPSASAAPIDASSPWNNITAPVIDKSQLLQDLLRLQLPLGWENVPVSNELVKISKEVGLSNPVYNVRNLWNFVPANNPNWFGLLLQKLIGLYMTALLVAQFAPFVFDLMRRLSGGSEANPAPPPPPSVNVTINPLSQ
jgi:hypothetical protein